MKTQEDRERYQKSPIYGSDFSKPVSVLIEEVRNELTKARGHLHDIEHGTCWGERVDHVIGLLTCGLVTLAHSKSEIVECEIRRDDEKRGKSLRFNPRGIGLDSCPGCFVCGGEKTLLNNIAAYVATKEQGEEIVGWFGQGARLDFREHEPNYLQVKIGACDEHLPQLRRLNESTSVYGIIRQIDISESREAS